MIIHDHLHKLEPRPPVVPSSPGIPGLEEFLGLPAVDQAPAQATIILRLLEAIEAETTAEEHRVHEQQDHPSRAHGCPMGCLGIFGDF